MAAVADLGLATPRTGIKFPDHNNFVFIARSFGSQVGRDVALVMPDSDTRKNI